MKLWVFGVLVPMTTRNLISIVLTAFALCCCTAKTGSVASDGELYLNPSAPVQERVADLVGRMTTEEKISLLRTLAPPVERLGIDKYFHGNEALHGVVRPGRFTVFPQAIAAEDKEAKVVVMKRFSLTD